MTLEISWRLILCLIAPPQVAKLELILMAVTKCLGLLNNEGALTKTATEYSNNYMGYQ